MPVAPASSVYVVDGVVFEERSDPRLHYRRINLPPEGYNWRYTCDFLYTELDHLDTWILGRGADLSTVKPIYRAPAREGKPTSTYWEHVNKTFFAPFKVFEVKNIGAHELKEIMEGVEDVIVKGNIICQGNNGKKLVIPKDCGYCDNECQSCNGIKDCTLGLDERDCSPNVTPSSEPSVYVIEDNEIGGRYFFNEILIFKIALNRARLHAQM